MVRAQGSVARSFVTPPQPPSGRATTTAAVTRSAGKAQLGSSTATTRSPQKRCQCTLGLPGTAAVARSTKLRCAMDDEEALAAQRIGTTLGDWRIERVLGVGAMGAVF